jgi:signal transduction histidine kinase/DNA-binding response OmpR family regulator
MGGVAFAFGAATTALGLVGVLAWVSGLPLLASLSRSYIPMAPSTAVAFALLGSALSLHAWGRSSKFLRRGVGCGIALVTLLSLLKLAQFFTGARLALDPEALLIRDPAMFGQVPTARMSPITAAGFLLSGLALGLLLVSRRPGRPRDVAGAMSSTVVLIGFTVLLGYAYGVPLLYGSWIIPVALTTASGFVGVGIGLVACSGSSAFPLRSLSGQSARARLLRAFLPTVVLAFLLSNLAHHAVLARFQVNAALVSVVTILVFITVIAVVVSWVAQVVGGAIDRAEIVLQRSQLELEQRVEERTLELGRTNRALQAEVLERKRAEEHAQQAQHAAERATRAKSEFLANMSHELRTPLNAIIGFSELLEDRTFGELNGRQTKYVSNVLTSGRHLLQLINDILDLSKIEAGRLTLQRAPVEVSVVIQGVTTVVRALADKKQIRLEVDSSADLPRLDADEAKLKQILYNLLSNAIKFTPDGGCVKVKGVATVRNPGGGPIVQIAVTDTGIGVKAEDHERIFEEFEQTDSSYARQQQGTGLGLALTRRLVELHGGRVWIESEGVPGRGSTFIVELPVSSSEILARSPAVGLIAGVPHTDGREPLRRPLVLIVEDDAQSSELLAVSLSQAGYGVAQAFDGQQALSMIDELSPDLVTLDVMLPKQDGLAVLGVIKSSPVTAEIPVVLVSVTDNRQLGLSLGALDWLVKPVDRKELLQAVSRAAGGVTSTRATVLVVDDNAQTVACVADMLQGQGYHVLKAYGGQEGIDLALQHFPEVIVLDLTMPEVSGFEVVERLREHPRGREITILVFTARDTTEGERQRLDGRVRAIVPKAVDAGLLREVGRALGAPLHSRNV